MKFDLKLHRRDISDDEIIADLKRVADSIDSNLTQNIYKELGKYAPSTIARRFKSWNNALELAGIPVKTFRDISKLDLFRNLENVWVSLGRQPKYVEMKFPLSKYTSVTYETYFGKWNIALEKFIEYINTEDESTEEQVAAHDEILKDSKLETIHKTKREISDRMRFRVLMRDGFTCKSCGRSPVKELGVELHVDHIIPWSKGGETEEDNLETKCKDCNLGKGNAFNK